MQRALGRRWVAPVDTSHRMMRDAEEPDGPDEPDSRPFRSSVPATPFSGAPPQAAAPRKSPADLLAGDRSLFLLPIGAFCRSTLAYARSEA
jgi:hypothetical protein